MRIGIQPDRTEDESYSDRWIEYLRARGVEARVLDLLGPGGIDQVRGCDGLMWRFTHPPHERHRAKTILGAIEHGLGLPVFPDTRTAWHYDQKKAQHYLLQSLGAPTPATWVFWNDAEASTWADSARYPVVFKMGGGAGSANVVKVSSRDQALRLIADAFHRGIFPMTFHEHRPPRGVPRSIRDARSAARRMVEAAKFAWSGRYPALDPGWWEPEKGSAYFQEFLPDNDFDTRITVIGDRAFGYRRYNRPGDFRASGSGNFAADPSLIDRRPVQIGFDVSRRGGFQCMAYDFLLRNNEPVITEISYTFVAWMVHACPGYWTPDLGWVARPVWPQDALADDFLARIEGSR